jgi:hypothetical protein
MNNTGKSSRSKYSNGHTRLSSSGVTNTTVGNAPRSSSVTGHMIATDSTDITDYRGKTGSKINNQNANPPS